MKKDSVYIKSLLYAHLTLEVAVLLECRDLKSSSELKSSDPDDECFRLLCDDFDLAAAARPFFCEDLELRTWVAALQGTKHVPVNNCPTLVTWNGLEKFELKIKLNLSRKTNNLKCLERSPIKGLCNSTILIQVRKMPTSKWSQDISDIQDISGKSQASKGVFHTYRTTLLEGL